MQMRHWMDLKGLTLRDVGERLAAVEPRLSTVPNESTVKKHVDGRVHPGPAFVERYRIVSMRAVGAEDWQALRVRRHVESVGADDMPPSALRAAGVRA